MGWKWIWNISSKLQWNYKSVVSQRVSYDVESEIEVHSCLDESRLNEEILIEQIHLYIQ